MSIYVCSNGHLIRAESSQISIDSLCAVCKSNERRRVKKTQAREAARVAFAKSLFDMVPRPARRKA